MLIAICYLIITVYICLWLWSWRKLITIQNKRPNNVNSFTFLLHNRTILHVNPDPFRLYLNETRTTDTY